MTLVLDKEKVRSSFAAASTTYDRVAGLQRQVGHDLLMRHPVTGRVDTLLDLGCGTGFLTELLLQGSRYQSLLVADIALPMLIQARSKLAEANVTYLCADAENLPLQPASLSHIYSNLALQWCQELQTVVRDLHRILTTGGRLVFSTFGVETLNELKTAWASVDDYSHVNEFFSVEQIRLFLQEAGFCNISVQTVLYQTRYESVMALMQELKHIGAHNVTAGRNRKPTTRTQLARMIEAYPRSSGNEVVAGYEIIFVAADKL